MISSALRRIKLGRLDAVGVGLAAALAAWIAVSAAVGDGNPLPQIALLVMTCAAYAAGRHFGNDRRSTIRAAASVVLAILMGVVLSGPDALSGAPLAPPLGYGNANGSLYVLGAAAAVLVALSAKPETVRATAGLFAGVFLFLAAMTLSKAATALAMGLILVTLVIRQLPRWFVFAGPLVITGTFAVTAALGLTHGRSIAPSLVDQLSERRSQLWRESIEIIAANPVFGVGPGMFAHKSPTAMSDSDARWAHSAYFQVATELGVVALVLLGLLLLWVFVAIYRSQQSDRLAIIGAAAVTALAVHAAIDYIAHFPAVVAIAALLAGLTSSRQAPG